MKMKLRTTLRSPFGQKVIIASKFLGITDKIDVVDTNFRDENDPIRIENPLGKMPVLTTEEGVYVYDSRVILEYLNDRFKGTLLPTDLHEKLQVKTIEALADGIIDAGVVIVLEGRMREAEFVYEPWKQFQREKMTRGFDALKKLDINPNTVNVATIAIACLLVWLPKAEPVSLGEHQAYFADWLTQFEQNILA